MEQKSRISPLNSNLSCILWLTVKLLTLAWDLHTDYKWVSKCQKFAGQVHPIWTQILDPHKSNFIIRFHYAIDRHTLQVHAPQMLDQLQYMNSAMLLNYTPESMLCTLPSLHCTLCTAHSTLHTAHCTLHNEFLWLHTAKHVLQNT